MPGMSRVERTREKKQLKYKKIREEKNRLEKFSKEYLIREAEENKRNLEKNNSSQILIENKNLIETYSDSNESENENENENEDNLIISPLNENNIINNPQLPLEIIDEIVNYLPLSFKIKMMFLCKTLYWYYLPQIYKNPNLVSQNYKKFALAISLNKKLGKFIEELDFRWIIQSGRNSLTSKILRLCGPYKLKTLHLSQTGVGYPVQLSLRNCINLTMLDMEIVSESIDPIFFLPILRHLKHLIFLYLPQTQALFKKAKDFNSLESKNYLSNHLLNEFNQINLNNSNNHNSNNHNSNNHNPNWNSLITLGIQGDLSNSLLINYDYNPQKLIALMVTKSLITSKTIAQILSNTNSKFFTSLVIQYPNPLLDENALDNIFKWCQGLNYLSISVEYLTEAAFLSKVPINKNQLLNNFSNNNNNNDITNFSLDIHPLCDLELDCSGGLGLVRKITPQCFYKVISMGAFPKLETVRVSGKLGWLEDEDELIDLIELLEFRGGGFWIF